MTGKADVRGEPSTALRGDAGSRVRRATDLYAAGRAELALAVAADGLRLEPGNADLALLAGVAAAALGRGEEAEGWYRQAIRHAPASSAANCNLGLLLAAQGRDGEAEAHYRRAIALAPGQPEAYTNLGLLLDKLGRDAEAEACHRHALRIKPESAEIHANLANLLGKRRREAEAEENYRRAIALAPESPVAYANLGSLLADQGRDAESEQWFRQALALRPGYPLARANLGYLLLAQGRYAEGWPLHETRHDPLLPNRPAIPPDVPYPQWQGESLAGKTLLVWPEQGFGDEIQFCRFVPELKARGARAVTLACKAPLKPLLETLAGADAVVAAGPGPGAIPPHDYWAFPMSLALRCAWDGGRETAPYLQAPPERVARWAPRLPTDGLRVGLAWRGNSSNSNDAERSLPGLGALAPLWSVPGVRFVSLQKGSGEEEAAAPPAAQPIVALGASFADFADAAAVIAQLDLVICVDTATAHVAGALGKPCWVLLPAHKTDWRWLKGRTDTPWYPSLRLFRQRQRGQWASVIDELRAALTILAAARYRTATRPSSP